MPGVEIRIASDGEILVKGNNVFGGYFKDPKNTKETFIDGWLKTGDIGELDKDGYLKITDRKKDLFKTSGGKYVAPGAMETQLRSQRGIAQAVVLGDGRPFVAALFTLERDTAEGKAGPHDPSAKRLGDEAVQKLNRGLSHPEQIKKWRILDTDFVVGDELTPSMKVKRKVVVERHRARLDSLYEKSIVDGRRHLLDSLVVKRITLLAAAGLAAAFVFLLLLLPPKHLRLPPPAWPWYAGRTPSCGPGWHGCAPPSPSHSSWRATRSRSSEPSGATS